MGKDSPREVGRSIKEGADRGREERLLEAIAKGGREEETQGMVGEAEIGSLVGVSALSEDETGLGKGVGHQRVGV